nr:LPS-assembly protein LptD [Chthoniobacterales bacterium]
MRRLIFLFFVLLSPAVFAQTAQNSALKDQPIEITATGGTNYENGIASADENVAIHVGDTDIYGDHATYNTATKEVHVEGNVRIYRGVEFYVGDRGTYNTETKAITADRLRTVNAPYLLGGDRITTMSDNGKLVENGIFTTHDSADPDFRLRARRVRVYEGDRVIMRDVTFYVGKVPIFYWPYIYQSLDDEFSFLISPAYLSTWGPSLLGHVTFPISENAKGTFRLDLRARRGIALGLDAELRYGESKRSFAKLRTYYLQDQNPLLNRTSLPRGSVPSERYRVSLQDRTYFTDDITGTIDVTKLSDRFVLQDFFQSEFRVDPQPDNVVALNKHSPNYSLTAFTRFQANNFFETTERLPEVALDITRQPVFGSPIFYEGESSFANLRRNFPSGSRNQDYESQRVDSFHQFLYPNTYFGWLAVVPRVGFRGTYYTESRDVSDVDFIRNDNPLIPDFILPRAVLESPLVRGGDRLRFLVNAGVEASFKVSRTWEQAQSRALGLDGMRHIIQPFVNFSYVTGNGNNPAELLQFDRYIPSTQLRPLDFPQFTSIDSIDHWSIARVGVRNRLQTRRDDITINWLELQTYFDINFDNPYDRTDYSNVYNRLRFSPLPWASLSISSQLPLLSNGFTEVNTTVAFQPTASLALNFGHRFLNENPFFQNSSLYSLAAYYRLNDNWALGAYGRYEASTGFLEEQRYTVYRDLTSWVASLGAVIRNNGSVKEYGVLLTFSLKALPKFSFD